MSASLGAGESFVYFYNIFASEPTRIRQYIWWAGQTQPLLSLDNMSFFSIHWVGKAQRSEGIVVHHIHIFPVDMWTEIIAPQGFHIPTRAYQ